MTLRPPVCCLGGIRLGLPLRTFPMQAFTIMRATIPSTKTPDGNVGVLPCDEELDTLLHVVPVVSLLPRRSITGERRLILERDSDGW
ncbi:hypothetical protein PIIN_08735 [Serendipita indica DSM 11827]|uniref:Uncharacterized protein n=1 Tax=Serendipita indica (strain DSM 11827) TaxID=1109443 RepID=G4TTY4_SERID|nr:hypothetical protein PIIN_08735 [Serendipita indica DSM 11827]